MPPAAAAAVQPTVVDATAAGDLSESGVAVLAIPDLVARICKGLDSAAVGANFRQACKQTASSLDWFDLMWHARQDIPKVHRAVKEHEPVVVPLARIKGIIISSLGAVWSCPPLLKWVVMQAAKQGDAELLGAVLGRKQQKQQHPDQTQPQQEKQQQPDKPNLKQAEQRQQQQQGQMNVRGGDMVQYELRLHNALQNAAGVSQELGVPAVLAKYLPNDGGPAACVWLIALAAEEAVRSNNPQLLVQIVKERWFRDVAVKRWESHRTPLFWEMLALNISGLTISTSVKQQLGPAFLAAAAAGDVESGTALLSYCPDLLDYALWKSPADMQASIISRSLPEIHQVLSSTSGGGSKGPFLEVLPLVYQLDRAGFKGLKLTVKPDYVLAHLCYHNQQHQSRLVQMLLELGVVSSRGCVVYTPSEGVRIAKGYRYGLEFDFPIIAAAVGEQNAGAVAVLAAAGAVLPAPGQQQLPFNYDDLEAVLQELEQQAAVAGGGEMATKCRAAADTVRAYCEKHGHEKIDAK